MTESRMTRSAALVLAIGLASASVPAAAQSRYVFGNTHDETFPRATLTFDGVTTFIATDTGFISAGGAHLSTNPNYITGTYDGVRHNSWFNFALGALAPVSPYTSAILTLRTGNSVGVDMSSPATLDLFDVDASLLELDRTRTGDAAGRALFADLGSGTRYGSYSFTQPTGLGQTISITLNGDFLARVNAGLVEDFSIGGSLASNPGSAVPEPAAWAMMMIGFGGIGAALRRRTRIGVRFRLA